MKLLSRKNAKPAAAVAQSRQDEGMQPSQIRSPADDLVDLEELAQWKRDLRQLEADYRRGQTALVAARRLVSGVDPLPEPDLTWHVQRELLVAVGDAVAVATFDKEHAADLDAELAGRQRALQGAAEARARVKALEKHLNGIAAKMQVLADGNGYREIVRRLFRPSAQRMLDRAREFAQAHREMVAMDSVLRGATRMHQRYTDGSKIETDDFDLIGRKEKDDWLSVDIEGLDFRELIDLNRTYGRYDNDLSTVLHQRLEQAGIDSSWVSVFHPTDEADDRHVYAPDPNPPKKNESLVTIIH
ncbi:hypothetical protein [Lysobacter sp. CA199]|uniref:hypothetical protein n=1 Tax=Lysobacter sp. CA199 TaxID=3455608 RepID=UPI003F8D2DD2